MNLMLVGCSGRMGRTVASLAREENVAIACGIDEIFSPFPFPVYRTIEEARERADVLLDFSSPRNLTARLSYCKERALPAVIGVTGLSEEDRRAIEEASAHFPILLSANFSLGICVLERLVRHAAALLRDWDVEIVECHHRDKKDAPSGTALALAASASAARTNKKVPIHSIRGGTVTGEHELLFLGEEETISLSHAAFSPKVFALGALRAVKRLPGHPPGLYSMQDLFEFSISESPTAT